MFTVSIIISVLFSIWYTKRLEASLLTQMNTSVQSALEQSTQNIFNTINSQIEDKYQIQKNNFEQFLSNIF